MPRPLNRFLLPGLCLSLIASNGCSPSSSESIFVSPAASSRCYVSLSSEWVNPTEPDLTLRPGGVRPPVRCYLGRQMHRATGKTEWRVTLIPDPDSEAIVLLENESNGEKGRFEVQCQEKRVVLLGFAKGSDPFVSAGWFSGLRTGMANLPESYQRQLLALCPKDSKPKGESLLHPGQ